MNKKTMNFSREMYDKQKADNLENWYRQNEYNSPKSQMARLRDANLNPALMYGNSSAGISAGSIDSSSAPSWNPRAPQVDGNPIMDMYQIKMQSQMYDNAMKQNTLMDQELLLKKAQTLSALANADLTATKGQDLAYDFGYKQSMENVRRETENVRLDKLGADLNYTLDENVRRNVMTSQNVSESVQRIAESWYRVNKLGPAQINEINARIDQMKKSGRLMELDAQLKEVGLQPSDPAYLRIPYQIARGLFDDVDASAAGTIGKAVTAGSPYGGYFSPSPGRKAGEKQFTSGDAIKKYLQKR